MSLINEYIAKMSKGVSVLDLESELLHLIKQYNELRNTYLFVYSAAIEKQVPHVTIRQSDYYTIHSMLKNVESKNIDFYIESPGGSGEAAEEIVKFLHNKFNKVSFVISGESKSAGTIIALSGDEILMTETGSLGPIDAQLKIGRSVVSASDYIDWVDKTRDYAEKHKGLNSFDATVVAQISPGELEGVFHALKFAEDNVADWLAQYKFKGWDVTETSKKPVTEKMKKARAKEIATQLTKHSKWRTHGRSLKIDDLKEIGLKITRIDEDKKLADITYREYKCYVT